MIAPLTVWRRGEDDFLLLTEPELGEVVLRHLTRMRLRAQVEIEPEEHTSHVVLGGGDGIPTADYGTPAVEVLDADLEPTLGEDELERLRVLAGTPRWGREIDDRILPAEAGLDETRDLLHKGLLPRSGAGRPATPSGRANRALRLLEIGGRSCRPTTPSCRTTARRWGESRVPSTTTARSRLSPMSDARCPRTPCSNWGRRSPGRSDSMTTRP